ncbi:MAG: hypothetical protein ACP5SF_02895 [Thermoplasmata archaeon]
MSDLNEDLKKIKDAEEAITKMIKEENDKAQARIEEARKKADEILRRAEEDLNRLKTSLEIENNEKIENEINNLKKEWEEKMRKLNDIKIDEKYILEIVKSLLEEK